MKGKPIAADSLRIIPELMAVEPPIRLFSTVKCCSMMQAILAVVLLAQFSVPL